MILAELERVLSAHGTARTGQDLVLVACSGGVDSVVLAHACVVLLGARRVLLGHVDHAQRASSGQDGALVRALAESLGAGFDSRRLEPGSSAEARLRIERYRALEAMRRVAGARLVLTAHTEDDQAETVLLGFVRATRIIALGGIPVARGAVLRPLLGIGRATVLDYAARHGLAFASDPSNAEAHYLRSRLRKELLPLLEARYRPGMARRLARLAQDRGQPASLDPAQGAALAPRPTQASAAPSENPPQSETQGWWSAWLAAGAPIQIERRGTGAGLVAGPFLAIFDAQSLDGPQVRRAQDGDRMSPKGLLGRRKLKDLYREAGIPAALRPHMPVVAAGGQVVWVPGVAQSAVGQVAETTREVWVFSIQVDTELPVSGSRATLTNGEDQ